MSYKKLSSVSLTDLYKRVPKNQVQEFMVFRERRKEYIKQLNKYPEHLPKINWEYYRQNVRQEYVKMVCEFEKKYEELNKIFDCRHELDTCEYYMELEKKREEVKEDVEKFVRESNCRIQALQEQVEHVSSLLPYEDMTMEEYIENSHNPLFTPNGDPSFWPHDPDEQTPGPVGFPHGHGEAEDKDVVTENVMVELEKQKQLSEAAEQRQLEGKPPLEEMDKPQIDGAKPEANKKKMDAKAEVDVPKMDAVVKKPEGEQADHIEAKQKRDAKKRDKSLKKEKKKKSGDGFTDDDEIETE